MWKGTENISEPMEAHVKGGMGTQVKQWKLHVKAKWEYEWTNKNHVWKGTDFSLRKMGGQKIIYIHHYVDVKPQNLIKKTEVQFPCKNDITQILLPHKEHILLP